MTTKADFDFHPQPSHDRNVGNPTAAIPPHANTKLFSGPDPTLCRANTMNPDLSLAFHNGFFYSFRTRLLPPHNEHRPRPAESAAICDNKQRSSAAFYRVARFFPLAVCLFSLSPAPPPPSGPPFILQHFARNVRGGEGRKGAGWVGGWVSGCSPKNCQ